MCYDYLFRLSTITVVTTQLYNHSSLNLPAPKKWYGIHFSKISNSEEPLN